MADEETQQNEERKDDTPEWAKKLSESMQNLTAMLSESFQKEEPTDPNEPQEIPIPEPPEPPTPEQVEQEQEQEQEKEEPKKKRNFLSWLM